MRLTSLITMCGVLILAAPVAAGGVAIDYFDPPSLLAGEPDPEMLSARKRARQTVARFIKRLHERSPADLEFAVQIEITEGVDTEQLWLSDVRYERGFFSGFVDGRPLQIESVEVGQRLRIPRAEITDWMIVERTLYGERLVGAFTVEVLESRELRGVIPELAAL